MFRQQLQIGMAVDFIINLLRFNQSKYHTIFAFLFTKTLYLILLMCDLFIIFTT
ncbi:hypothetical protein HMP0015_3250 [Acinetobacter haemolyticus ATCC 19194]|uniref:Uncharacterized protein n=1 Tax=Acinetobacter haemolyticus ATCC 19194 TaxID=707232 RepID=D4XU58_ACIHA|nr:hypothetical protein HMP0015_3250 [Acinetobacter haemolyticus ATCC 19194]